MSYSYTREHAKETTYTTSSGKAATLATFIDGQDIDRKDEEDEDGEEIAENIRYNEILYTLKQQKFSRRMSENERGEFECLEEEARENYRRLHPEEFDEEEDN